MTGAEMSTSGVLRVAAFPGESWVEAGNPGLFELVRKAQARSCEYSMSSRGAAERIGRELVPHPSLSKRDRTLVLQVRRRLYQCGTVADDLLEHVRVRCESALGGKSDLVQTLQLVRLRREAVADTEARLERAVRDEEARLLALPWTMVSSSPIIERAMREADQGLFEDIEGRVAVGEPWTTRRMRRRSEHMWRLIDRGTVKPTPRGWFAHAGLVRLDNSVGTPGFSVADDPVSYQTENLHKRRGDSASADLDRAHVETPVALASLHWLDDQSFEAWVVMPGSDVEATAVTLRRTPLLDSICRHLRRGARSLGELEADVVADDGGSLPRDLVRGFLGYLAGIGVLDVGARRRTQLSGWAGRDTDQEPAAGDGPASGVRTRDRFDGPRGGDETYVDGFRHVVSTGVGGFAQELETLTGQAMRLLRAMADDAAALPPRSTVIGPEPLPVLQLLKQQKLAGDAPRARVLRGPWHVPATAGSAYTALIETVDARHDCRTFDLNAAMLDDLGAPAHHLDWPVDVLVRLLSPRNAGAPLAAIDTLYPAGALDARFAGALGELHGGVDHLEWYREFLREVERRTGYLFVEVLVPPLARRAANAVRRPRMTNAWTGDADSAAYFGHSGNGRYIPLADIRLRRSGRRIIATVDDKPIWPVHHTTRNPVAPWDGLVSLLLSASHRPLQYVSSANLQQPFDAFPDCAHLPRITICNRLIVSCEQWRVHRSRLWQPTDTTVDKARAIDRLRQDLNLPRFVYLLPPYGIPGVCCDLESLRSLRVIDRVLESSETTFVITEALPAPNDFPVADCAVTQPAHLAAELMLRLPLGLPPQKLAARVAALAPSSDTTPQGTHAVGAETRGGRRRSAGSVPSPLGGLVKH